MFPENTRIHKTVFTKWDISDKPRLRQCTAGRNDKLLKPFTITEVGSRVLNDWVLNV
jgi:hypothetical protein